MSENSTRQDVFGQGASASTHPAHGDPHPGWHAEIDRLEAEYQADEGLFEGHCAEIFRLETLIGKTPARTVAGVRVQLEMVLSCHRSGSILGPVEEAAIENAMASIELLAAQA